MSKLIQFLGIVAVIFLVVVLVVGTLAVWDIVDAVEAQDAIVKTGYTMGIVVVVGTLVAFLVKMIGGNK
jgi:hypothetical protein